MTFFMYLSEFIEVFVGCYQLQVQLCFSKRLKVPSLAWLIPLLAVFVKQGVNSKTGYMFDNDITDCTHVNMQGACFKIMAHDTPKSMAQLTKKSTGVE